MDIQQGDRLPNEIRSSHKKQGRNRLLQRHVIHMIANKMGEKIGRSLQEMEIKGLISHIKRIDGMRYRSMPIEQAVDEISTGLLEYQQKQDHVIYDTHEIMKQYIGGGVEVDEDRFLIKKPCGDTNPTPNTVESVRKYGPHFKAYAMFPRLETPVSYGGVPTEEGMTAGAKKKHSKNPNVGATNNAVTKSSAEARNLGLRADISKRDEDNEGSPVYGFWLRKGNAIAPRERSVYALLDSRYRIRSTDAGTYSWTVTYNYSDTQGQVSIPIDFKNVIYMQFKEFHIPYVPAADTPYRKISLSINELQESSVMGHENRSYHMMFDTAIETNRIRLTPPSQDDGKFHFNAPINYMKKLSITFGNPLTPISFLPEFYVVTLTVNGLNSTYINFVINHNLADGEIIYITGFTTANPSNDFNDITNINNSLGHSIAVIDNTTIEITSDLSTSTMLNPAIPVECYITTRRILMEIRFVYVV